MEKLNRITLLDGSKRPKAPKFDGVTPQQRKHGLRLRWFHDMHRAQLNEVMQTMAHIEGDASVLAEQVSALKLRENIRRFGNLCGQECQMLTGHHGIEDAYIFPQLHDAGNDGLKKVVARLAAEHLVIHDLIEEMDRAAEAAVHSPGPESFTALKAALTTLNKIVLSHFGYEETELADALGIFGPDI